MFEMGIAEWEGGKGRCGTEGLEWAWAGGVSWEMCEDLMADEAAGYASGVVWRNPLPGPPPRNAGGGIEGKIGGEFIGGI